MKTKVSVKDAAVAMNNPAFRENNANMSRSRSSSRCHNRICYGKLDGKFEKFPL